MAASKKPASELALSPEQVDKPATPDPSPTPPSAPSQAGWRVKLRAFTTTRHGKLVLIAGGVAIVLAALLATPLRYPVLGLLYHNSGQVTILDTSTHQPLPDAKVALAGASTTTDQHGVAKLENLKLGHATLVITKSAYKTAFIKVTVPAYHRFSTPTVYLDSAGISVLFTVADKVSAKPLDGVALVSNEAKAISKEGKGRLVVLPGQTTKRTVTLSKDGFLDATLQVDLAQASHIYAVQMVPSGKVYFLSNRTGRIDLHSANLDGSGDTVVLAGTGKEDGQTGLLPSVTNPSLLAIVSSRNGNRDANGNLIHTLFVYNADTHKLQTVEDGVNFSDYRAWLGDTLVYQKIDGDCPVIKGYSPSTQKTAQIVNTQTGDCPFINATYDNIIFFSIQTNYPIDRGLFAIKSDGSGQKLLSAIPAQSIARTSESKIEFEYYDYNQPQPAIWQSINLDNLSVTRLSNAPTSVNYRSYVSSASGKYQTFIESRDGQNNVYLTDEEGGNEKPLTSLEGVNQFVQWYGDDYIVFSANNALYVVATSGGTPQKISSFYSGNVNTYGGGYNPNY